MKLAIFDLDGTLFDTREVNYYAYKDALNTYGYDLSYKYFVNECNGKHYMEFLPKIVDGKKDLLEKIHELKKEKYQFHLDKSYPNSHLLEMIPLLRNKYKTALVTTASLKNAKQILEQFKVSSIFDVLITQEDVSKMKPDPEGFILAMKNFDVKPEDTIIFEDSPIGIEAAKQSGAGYFIVGGYS